tara:strand:- start:1450 stop:2388 length:939 start_codon:yes stop_codon:yes gene_type:complete
MGLSNGAQPTEQSVMLNGTSHSDAILRLSTSSFEPKGGPTYDCRVASASEIGALNLARFGKLIPAVLSAEVTPYENIELRKDLENKVILKVTADQIEQLIGSTTLEVVHVSDGPVPLEEAEDARFMCFREANGMLEHVAIVIGDQNAWTDPVPVRIHSACLTGDLFGSLRCDCGEQLRGSLAFFAEKGGGVLLYLAQEGRGIGLANKLRAYKLQNEGFDTVDADCTLGFGPDERTYDVAVEMLRYLKIDRIQLLTNNPEKVRAVRNSGIEVVDRQGLYGTLNPHNREYVKAKVFRAGHWLGEMLSGSSQNGK